MVIILLLVLLDCQDWRSLRIARHRHRLFQWWISLVRLRTWEHESDRFHRISHGCPFRIWPIGHERVESWRNHLVGLVSTPRSITDRSSRLAIGQSTWISRWTVQEQSAIHRLLDTLPRWATPVPPSDLLLLSIAPGSLLDDILLSWLSIGSQSAHCTVLHLGQSHSIDADRTSSLRDDSTHVHLSSSTAFRFRLSNTNGLSTNESLQYQTSSEVSGDRLSILALHRSGEKCEEEERWTSFQLLDRRKKMLSTDRTWLLRVLSRFHCSEHRWVGFYHWHVYRIDLNIVVARKHLFFRNISEKMK